MEVLTAGLIRGYTRHDLSGTQHIDTDMSQRAHDQAQLRLPGPCNLPVPHYTMLPIGRG